MRNQEIAVQLNLSEHTVRNYLLRVFDKLGISNRVELVLYAFSGTEERHFREFENILRVSVNGNFKAQRSLPGRLCPCRSAL